MENPPKNAKIFYCAKCDFRCSKQSDWDRHIVRPKHINRQNNIVKNAIYACVKCCRVYKYNSGLWNHAKTCSVDTNEPNENIIVNDTPVADKNLIGLIMELMKENKEIIKDNQEFRQKMIEMAAKSTTTNINAHVGDNKTFNLQLFLNEQCKDAMNIGEFVDSFDIQLDELENVGNVGYVDGISRIITNRLKAIDIYKRPFHCSDLKRETIYVKDQNKWEKEEKSNPKLRKAIRAVTQKNMVKVGAWRDANPDCRSNKSHLNDQFIKIVRQASGGIAEITDSEDKIMRRLAKEVGIDKN
jgi:hypothetical protein